MSCVKMPPMPQRAQRTGGARYSSLVLALITTAGVLLCVASLLCTQSPLSDIIDVLRIVMLAILLLYLARSVAAAAPRGRCTSEPG